MAKRFTDSEKFRDAWYRKLSPVHKCLWEYLLSECSLAGIIELDYEAMSFHIGSKIIENDLMAFQDRVHLLPDGKIFLLSFIKFQQNSINKNNPAHKNIIKELEKYNIPESLDIQDIQSPFEAPLKPLGRVISKGKGNSKGNGSSKSNGFEEFWKAWTAYKTGKGGKQDARESYQKALKLITHENLMKSSKEYCSFCLATDCNTKNVFRWLNKNGWEDDYTTPKQSIKGNDNGTQSADDITREIAKEYYIDEPEDRPDTHAGIAVLQHFQ